LPIKRRNPTLHSIVFWHPEGDEIKKVFNAFARPAAGRLLDWYLHALDAQ
jgi:hypothetical protein